MVENKHRLPDEAQMGREAYGSKEAKDQRKKRRKKRRLWTVVFWVAIVVLVGCGGVLGALLWSYHQGDAVYNDLAADNLQVMEPAADEDLVFSVDWDALRAINEDLVGWVYMPDSPISYPIVHRDGDDQYYLHRNFNRESSQFGAEHGAIMLSGDNSADFSDELNFIYGHNLYNGGMFHILEGFLDSEEFNAHRRMYVITPEGTYVLTTFAAVQWPASDGSIVQPNFETPEEETEYLQRIMAESRVTPDPAAPPVEDMHKIFAFATCWNQNTNYRRIVFAYTDKFVPADGSAATGNIDATDMGEDAASEIAGDADARKE